MNMTALAVIVFTGLLILSTIWFLFGFGGVLGTVLMAVFGLLAIVGYDKVKYGE